MLLSNNCITIRPPIFNLFSQKQIGCSKFPLFGNFDLLITWFDLQKHINVFNNLYDNNMDPSFNWWALSQISGRKRSTSQALFLKSDFVHFLWFLNKIGYTKFINWLRINRSSYYENSIPSTWIDVYTILVIDYWKVLKQQQQSWFFSPNWYTLRIQGILSQKSKHVFIWDGAQ